MRDKDKKKILIIDDDTSLLEIYSLAFKAEGFNVSTAVNGEEGLKKALAQMPDLILLDIMMPVMDGLTMIQKLRQENEYGKNVFVIMLTNASAGGKVDVIENIAKTQPISYIIKSNFKPDQVVEKVKDCLGIDW